MGIGLITKEFITKEIKDGTLFEIKTNSTISNRHIGMIYLENKKLSHCAKLFLKLLEKKL